MKTGTLWVFDALEILAPGVLEKIKSKDKHFCSLKSTSKVIDVEALKKHVLKRQKRQLKALLDTCLKIAYPWFVAWIPSIRTDNREFLFQAAGLSDDANVRPSDSDRIILNQIRPILGALERRFDDFDDEADEEWRQKRRARIKTRTLSVKDIEILRSDCSFRAVMGAEELLAGWSWSTDEWQLDGPSQAARAFTKRASHAAEVVIGVGTVWQRWLDLIMPDAFEWTTQLYGVGQIPNVCQSSEQFVEDLLMIARQKEGGKSHKSKRPETSTPAPPPSPATKSQSKTLEWYRLGNALMKECGGLKADGRGKYGEKTVKTVCLFFDQKQFPFPEKGGEYIWNERSWDDMRIGSFRHVISTLRNIAERGSS